MFPGFDANILGSGKEMILIQIMIYLIFLYDTLGIFEIGKINGFQNHFSGRLCRTNDEHFRTPNFF